VSITHIPTVVKVGGSLLTQVGFEKRLATWLQTIDAPVVLLAGGGPLANILREQAPVHHWEEETAHWMCIRAMSTSAHWLAACLEHTSVNARICDDWEQLQREIAAEENGVIIFDSWSFCRSHEPKLPNCLPHNWSVTSDSIAMRIAEILNAKRGVLLKSASPPMSHSKNGATLASWQKMADLGYVDEYFPTIAGRLRFDVEMVNLNQLLNERPA